MAPRDAAVGSAPIARSLRAVPGSGDGVAVAEPDPVLVGLIEDVRAGDHTAWRGLVRRFDGRLRGIARSYRLGPADVDDVVQETWLELIERLQTIREPAAVGAWLATTTRRAAMRVKQRPLREELTDDPGLGDRSDEDGPEQRVLAAERLTTVRRALATLPARDRQLLALLAAELDYRRIGESLGMPMGSIGPIRGRCLERLGRHPELLALGDAVDGACIGAPR
jgi:RNA polymerase sigma factor (sigma-70 family)